MRNFTPSSRLAAGAVVAVLAIAGCNLSDTPVTGPGHSLPPRLLQDSLADYYPEPVAARLRALDSLQQAPESGVLPLGALRVDAITTEALFVNFSSNNVSVSIYGANPAGVAVGVSVQPTFPGTPFIITPWVWLPGGGVSLLASPSGGLNNTWPYSINAAGQVAGCARISGISTPVLWNSIYAAPVLLSTAGVPASYICAWQVADDGEVLGIFHGLAGERGLVRWSGGGAPAVTLVPAASGVMFSLIGGLPDGAALVNVGYPEVLGIVDASGNFTTLTEAAGVPSIYAPPFFPQGPAPDGTIPIGRLEGTTILPGKLVRTGLPWGPGAYRVEPLGLGNSGFTGGRPYIAWSATRLAGAAGTAGVPSSGSIVVWDEDDVTPIIPTSVAGEAWLWAGGGSVIARRNNVNPFAYQRIRLTFGVPDPGETPVGNDVTVTPEDQDGGTPVSLSFTSVSGGGTSSVTSSSAGAPPPQGFMLGSPPRYYEISTTATFTGPVGVCITYAPAEFRRPDLLRLFHDGGSGWGDVTTSHDVGAGRICGEVLTLSPFLLAESALEFAGFFAPIDNLPTANVVKAGQGVPVKFSLGGDFGLQVLASGYPKVQLIACSTAATQDVVEETVAAGGSELRYDADARQYIYVWKTDPGWSSTCRRLTLRFVDGQEQSALFRFTK